MSVTTLEDTMLAHSFDSVDFQESGTKRTSQHFHFRQVTSLKGRRIKGAMSRLLTKGRPLCTIPPTWGLEYHMTSGAVINLVLKLHYPGKYVSMALTVFSNFGNTLVR